MLSDHLGVASAAMRTYGQQANAAGDKIASIDLQEVFGRVAAMLPGGESGRRGGQVHTGPGGARMGQTDQRSGQ